MRLDTPNFHRWLATEKQLQQAERQLWRVILAREGESPSKPPPALVAEVASLRAEVHALFSEAMHEMRQVSQSLHHRYSTGIPVERPGDCVSDEQGRRSEPPPRAHPAPSTAQSPDRHPGPPEQR